MKKTENVKTLILSIAGIALLGLFLILGSSAWVFGALVFLPFLPAVLGRNFPAAFSGMKPCPVQVEESGKRR